MANFDIPFVDKNAERYALSKRIGTIAEHIKRDFLFPHSVPTGDFLFRDGQSSIEHINEGEWTHFDAQHAHWGYPECYAWFKQSVTVPAEFAGWPVVVEFAPSDSTWETINPQLILFVNGKLMQGLDHNHRYVQVLDCATGGEVLELAINAYTDAFAWKDPVRMRAMLKTLNPIAQQMYFDITTPLMVANLYDHDELARVRLIKALNQAVNLLDMADPTNLSAFETSAKAAIHYLDKHLYGAKSDITACCVGHTHIDVAWLWRLRQTRDKVGRSFGTVLKYMEQYPEYVFMSPQAQLYDYCKKDYPDVYERIKQRVKEGRWEVEGSMWVEADTNVSSGESLVRQFLVGKRYFKDEFGVDTKVMWLPDVFGYSGALPQIIKKSGLDYFMTTKISWSEYDKFPHDTFMWQGIDGTRVLSHFATGCDAKDSGHFTTYNSYLSPNQVIGGWQRYSNKNLNQEYLISYGYGDGGGGPTIDMLEHGKRMERGIEGCPVVRQMPSQQFFKELEASVKDDPKLPHWQGELYLQYHRGTLTSEALCKRYNRKSEFLYHDVETLAAIAHQLVGHGYPAEEILESWKLILLNQFHDIIPGSSIEAVYKDAYEQYDQVMSVGEYLAAAAEKSLLNKIPGNGIVVFNTLGHGRDDVVEITLKNSDDRIALYDSDGTELPSQLCHDGDKTIFLAKGVPAKGWKSFAYKAVDCDCELPSVKIKNRVIENDFYQLTFDKNYNVTSLIEKTGGNEIVPAGKLANRILAYEDRAFNYEAWDVKSYLREKCWHVDDVQSAEIIEQGAVRTVLRVVRKFLNSTIRQDMMFYPHSPRIDIVYHVDLQDKNICLKADYPVDVNTDRATFDIQFGNLQRTTHENTSWDFAQFEVCGHKWADLSDNGFGLSVLNDCKYGWTVKDGHIQPTMVRSPNGHYGNQDIGQHNFVYAMYPHAGTVAQSDVVRESYNLNAPLRAMMGTGETNGPLPQSFSLVSVDTPNIIIETVKKAEDSNAVVVRAYECWNRKTTATFNFGGSVKRISECDLMEESAVSCDATLTFKPFEIKTLLVEFA